MHTLTSRCWDICFADYRPPAKLDAVKRALNEVEVFRLTIIDVLGFGRQKGHAEVYRGHELTVNMLRKVQLQIAVTRR